LRLLSDAKGNILDDEELINTLQISNVEGKEIEEKIKSIDSFKITFEKIRDFYKDCAKRSSNLFFAVMDLANIEPVY
jgi:dynein heavy chain